MESDVQKKQTTPPHLQNTQALVTLPPEDTTRSVFRTQSATVLLILSLKQAIRFDKAHFPGI